MGVAHTQDAYAIAALTGNHLANLRDLPTRLISHYLEAEA